MHNKKSKQKNDKTLRQKFAEAASPVLHFFTGGLIGRHKLIEMAEKGRGGKDNERIIHAIEIRTLRMNMVHHIGTAAYCGAVVISLTTSAFSMPILLSALYAVNLAWACERIFFASHYQKRQLKHIQKQAQKRLQKKRKKHKHMLLNGEI